MERWIKEGSLSCSVCPEQDGQMPRRGVEEITTDVKRQEATEEGGREKGPEKR